MNPEILATILTVAGAQFAGLLAIWRMIDSVRRDLNTRIDGVQRNMDARFDGVRSDIAAVNTRIDNILLADRATRQAG